MVSRIVPQTQALNAMTCCPAVSRCFQKLKELIQKIKDFIFGRSSTREAPRPKIAEAAISTASPETNLIRFYRGQEPNDRGITLERILNADDAWLESEHGWVQWAFPTTQTSQHLSTEPILDDATINTFRDDPELRANVERVFDRTLKFFGLKKEDRRIVRADNFAERSAVWLTAGNHNFLRITRIIHSLQLVLGPEKTASRAFFRIMTDIYQKEGKGIISKVSYDYWKNAYGPIGV